MYIKCKVKQPCTKVALSHRQAMQVPQTRDTEQGNKPTRMYLLTVYAQQFTCDNRKVCCKCKLVHALSCCVWVRRATPCTCESLNLSLPPSLPPLPSLPLHLPIPPTPSYPSSLHLSQSLYTYDHRMSHNRGYLPGVGVGGPVGTLEGTGVGSGIELDCGPNSLSCSW